MAVELATSPTRRSFARTRDVMPLPNLIQMQVDAFHWFQDEGLRELFEEVSPITDFAGKMSLEFIVPEKPFGEPKYNEHECRERDMTYSAPLTVRAKLRKNVTAEGEPLGEIIEQEIFMGDFPLMTEQGTFVINGAERVVVSQLVRSPGVYYTSEVDAATGRDLYMAKLIPNRGAWLEFETSNKNVLTVKVDRKRKIPVTTLLRASRLWNRRARSRHSSPRSTSIPTTNTSIHARPRHHRGREDRPDRDVQEAPAGRPAHAGERPQPDQLAVLQRSPVRPRPRGTVQAEQAPGLPARERADPACADQREDLVTIVREHDPAE